MSSALWIAYLPSRRASREARYESAWILSRKATTSHNGSSRAFQYDSECR